MSIPIAQPGSAVRDELARVASSTVPARTRTLVVGRVATPVAETLRACGLDAVIGLSDRFHRDETRYPIAVAAGLIEYDRWDRWALQRLHHVLEDGGMLLLAAPRLVSLATVLEPGFVWAVADKQLRKHLRRGPAPFRGRKYSAGGLTRMLEGLGFQVTRVTPLGAGHLLVVARRGPSMAGLSPTRVAPAPEAWLAAFVREQAAFIAARDTWRARHRPLDRVVREFDPAAWAGCDALVLAPHPDDEVIGCGGTLARLISAGARVTQVQATDGSDSAAFTSETSEEERRTVRLAEAERVAQAIRFTETVCWREDNRAFHHSEAAVARLAGLLVRTRPSLVFIPFVTDIHPDHQTLCRILADALERVPEVARGAQVLNYEVWSLLPPDTCCEVRGEMDLLERLLFLYETALKLEDYVHFVEARRRYHALRSLGREGFAEGFVTVPGADYPRWYRAGGDTPGA